MICDDFSLADGNYICQGQLLQFSLNHAIPYKMANLLFTKIKCYSIWIWHLLKLDTADISPVPIYR